LNKSKSNLDKTQFDVLKTYEDLKGSNNQLNIIMNDVDHDVKYNREFERINYQNNIVEIQDVRQRIKYQQEINSRMVQDLKI